MAKFLLISGSPRKGNTEFVLNKIFDSIEGEKELILLREKNIKHCMGCLSCDKTKKCVIDDDMAEILKKLENADVVVIGTPNYYDNVSGLMKDFIDRTNPFYETGKLKGKKMFAIVVGGGDVKNSEFVGNQILKNFAQAHEMDFVGSHCFQALKLGELETNPELQAQIDKIIKSITEIQ